MVKTKRSLAIMALLTVILLSVCLSVFMCANSTVAHAETTAENGDIEPYGVYTKLTLVIGTEYGGNTVWAKVHNDFTLGFSTVEVIVELYSSLENKDSCDSMKLESSDYIDDLNIYKSFYTYAEINGVQRYWRAKMKYSVDGKPWKYGETATRPISEDGKFLDI